MSILSGIFVYILIWWVIIFCVLPLDIKSVKDPKDGTMPGAPINPGMKRKLILTTFISCAVWIMIEWIVLYGGISFHDIAARMAM